MAGKTSAVSDHKTLNVTLRVRGEFPALGDATDTVAVYCPGANEPATAWMFSVVGVDVPASATDSHPVPV